MVTFAPGSNIGETDFSSSTMDILFVVEDIQNNLRAAYLAANPHSGVYTRSADSSNWIKTQ
jgi:hypothetical protein